MEGLVRGFSEAGLNFEVHVFAAERLSRLRRTEL